jgi:poly-gamma-glutamate capsule biosynthesis protein CapA/YwtB (metallophosphatase superfamily)
VSVARALRALSCALIACALVWPARAQQAAAPAGSVTLGAGGDLLAHIRVIHAAEASTDGFDHVLGTLSSIVDPEEIAFANLETPLSVERPIATGSPPVLGAPPELASALARAGIDVLSLANNHAYDQLPRGATRTREAVSAAQILGVGLGATVDESLAPVLVQRGGLRVAFLAFTQFVNGRPRRGPQETEVARWDEPSMIAAVERARARADLVVVSMHWSFDFVDHPSPRQRRAVAHLVEHGADVILGHGPHVLQSVERMRSARGDAICAYSLGNLLSNQGARYVVGRDRPRSVHPAVWMPETRDGAWLRVTVARGPDGLTIAPVIAVPLFTYNNLREREDLGQTEDIRIQRLSEVEDPALREERRAAIAAALGDEVTLSL